VRHKRNQPSGPESARNEARGAGQVFLWISAGKYCILCWYRASCRLQAAPF